VTQAHKTEAAMHAKEYFFEASLFYAKSANPKRKALVFRRFARAAEAIRFAVEELAPKLLDGCSLEVNETHYFGREIRPLYDDNIFPLRRRRINLVRELKVDPSKLGARRTKAKS
jgi:hypothetical protein